MLLALWRKLIARIADRAGLRVGKGWPANGPNKSRRPFRIDEAALAALVRTLRVVGRVGSGEMGACHDAAGCYFIGIVHRLECPDGARGIVVGAADSRT